MALGRNLKKQSLIPSEEENKYEKKTVTEPKADRKATTAVKVKPAAKKNPVKKEKKEASKPAPEPVVQTVPVVHAPEPAPVMEKIQEVKLAQRVEPKTRISKQEFETRKSLHDRFHKDVEALKGRVVHLIIFKLGEEEFAIEISKINEVVVTPSITRMPKAPDYIPGIATIRGRSIVTIDMARKLGIEQTIAESERRKYTIVINTERYVVGILVPQVPTNQRITGDIIQPTSDNVSATSIDETYIKGLIRMTDRVIFFMDIDALIEGDRMPSRVSQD